MERETVIQLLRRFSAKVGLDLPAGAFGQQERTVLQLLELLQEAQDELMAEPWLKVTARRSFTTIASENQGPLASANVFGEDFLSLVHGTLWDATDQRPYIGPMSLNEYQALKTSNFSGATLKYIVIQDDLYLCPAATAGHTVSAICQVKWGIADNLGAPKPVFTADDDKSIFTRDLLMAELEWRFQRQNQQSFAVKYAEAMMKRAAFRSRQHGLNTIRMDEHLPPPRPGIVIPEGNWNV